VAGRFQAGVEIFACEKLSTIADGTPALIPAFSPQEKENHSPLSWNVVSQRLSDAHRVI
jgi:hypothetical protein